MTVRRAEPAEAETVAALVNAAFAVERFFVADDRTSAAEVARLMTKDEFLVLDDPAGGLLACVQVAIDGPRGYFGLLAIAPAQQRRGLGRAMVEAVERHCRARGCTVLELRIVDLREELPPFYRALGFEPTGVAPYTGERVKRPCQFVLMAKSLV